MYAPWRFFSALLDGAFNRSTCRDVVAGGVENPRAGSAGTGETEAFNTYDCGDSACPTELGLHTVLVAESLPWSSVLANEVTTTRQVTSGVNFDDERLEGERELASHELVGSLRPSLRNGTSALHPSLLEFDSQSAELEGEGSHGEVDYQDEGNLKVLSATKKRT